jgi:hypothetical protein
MLSSPKRPEWLFGPPSLQFNGYRFLFYPRTKRLVCKPHIMPRLGVSGALLPLSIHFYGVTRQILHFSITFHVRLGSRIKFYTNYLLFASPSYPLDLMKYVIFGEKYKLLSFWVVFRSLLLGSASHFFRILSACLSYLNATVVINLFSYSGNA